MASVEEKIADVPAEDLLNPTASGYLDKKRPVKNFLPEKYHKRWCVIYNRIFYYYERPTDRKQKGAFSLKGYRVKPSATDELGFSLVCEGKDRNFFFRAQSIEEVSNWKKSVFKASRGDKTNNNIYDSPPPQRHISRSEPKSIRSKIKMDKNVSSSIDMGIYGSFDKKSNEKIYGSIRRKAAPTRHDSLPEEDRVTGPETHRDRSSSEPIIPEFERNAVLSSLKSQDSPPVYSQISKQNKKRFDSTIGSSPPNKGNSRSQSPQLASGYRASDTHDVPRRPLPHPPSMDHPPVQQVTSIKPQQSLDARIASPKQSLRKKPLPAPPENQNNETVYTSSNPTKTNFNTLPRARKGTGSPNNVQSPSVARKLQQENKSVSHLQITLRKSNRQKYSKDNDSQDLYYLSDSDNSDYEEVDTVDSVLKTDSGDEPVYDRPGSYRISVNDSDIDQEGYLTKMSNKIPSFKAREKVKKNYSVPNLKSFSDHTTGRVHLQRHQRIIDPSMNYFPLDEYGYVIFVPLEEPDQVESEDDYDTISRLSTVSTSSDLYSSVTDIEMIIADFPRRVEEDEPASTNKIQDSLSTSDLSHDYVNVAKFRKTSKEDSKPEDAGNIKPRDNTPTGKEDIHSLIKNELQQVLHKPVTKQYSEMSYLNRPKVLPDQSRNNSGRLNKSRLTRLQRNVQSIAPETTVSQGSSEGTSDSDSDYESVI